MASIAARVELGLSLADATVAEGGRPETVRGWLRRGRSDKAGTYREFATAIEQARDTAQNRPEPMDADELALRVSEMVRRGSVQAAKLRWEMLRAPQDGEGEGVQDADDDPLAEVDELARRRAERA